MVQPVVLFYKFLLWYMLYRLLRATMFFIKELILASDKLIVDAKKVHDHFNGQDYDEGQSNVGGSRENKDSVNHGYHRSGIKPSASGLLLNNSRSEECSRT